MQAGQRCMSSQIHLPTPNHKFGSLEAKESNQEIRQDNTTEAGHFVVTVFHNCFDLAFDYFVENRKGELKARVDKINTTCLSWALRPQPAMTHCEASMCLNLFRTKEGSNDPAELINARGRLGAGLDFD